MFGYIKVDKANLLGKEFEAYKGIYCSLCKQLGKDYSILARFILSYDCTFYAMLALDLAPDPPCYRQGRCRFDPLKKCNYAQSETEALPLAAALSVVSAYYKLMDNLHDSPWYKRIAYRLVQPFFARWRKKAAKKYAEIDASVKKMTENQWRAEDAPDCVLDRAAEPTAVMLSEMCALLTEYIPLRNGLEKDRTKRILSATGYFIGRWIYLVDAADDYEKDQKHHNFNPFLLPSSQTDDLPAYIEASLNHALSEALLSYSLSEAGRYDSIIQNVLRISCVNIQNNIISQFHPNTEDSER
ncbi:MAG: hypothetical protein IJV48_04980 [Ruminococcus sp.]|nr:hypothetical protein [Ruminococcus sp.]